MKTIKFHTVKTARSCLDSFSKEYSDQSFPEFQVEQVPEKVIDYSLSDWELKWCRKMELENTLIIMLG